MNKDELSKGQTDKDKALSPEVMPATKLDETEAVTPAKEDEPSSVELVVNEWARLVTSNTPISRSTPALNFFREKLPLLIEALNEEIKP